MAGEITVERVSDTLFVARMDGTLVGRARTAIGDGVWEAFSTVVEPTYRGHHIGAHLAEALLDAADTAGVTVVPSCWFIDGYMDRHPDRYRHLRDGHRVEPVGSPEDPHCRIAPAFVTSGDPSS
jgi:uncharacterized protein